jgi:hypothetical protein
MSSGVLKHATLVATLGTGVAQPGYVFAKASDNDLAEFPVFLAYRGK